MRAAVLFTSPGKVSIEDVVVDRPQRREVLVRLVATGLCHSDGHYLEGGYTLTRPIVLGHEGAGVVEAVGEDVTYVRPGDHVVSLALGFCGQCEWCLSGRPALCDQENLARRPGEPPRVRLGDGTECTQKSGLATFAEQMLVHETALVRIDPQFPLDRAALLGCGVSTGVGAVIRTAKVPPGASVAVIGCGGIGLNCVQGAVLAGASRIVAIDINAGKLDRAREFGATDVIDNSAGDAVEQLRDLLPGSGGVDYSFEALGRPETYRLAFDILRPAGTATVIGLFGGTVELPAQAFLAGELRIQGSKLGSIRARQDVPFLLDLYAAGRLKLDELVSSRISLDQINEAFAAIGEGSVARSVVVFE